MVLSREASERIHCLRFPLIVGVVFIHAYESQVGFADQVLGLPGTNFAVHFICDLISQGIARIAVPLFFLISGFLFFNHFSGSWGEYSQKLRKRFHTLLVPYFFWNTLMLVFIALAQTSPLTHHFFSGKVPQITSLKGLDLVNVWLGGDRFPICYQFWFIRDLMVLIALSPILYKAQRTFPHLVGICLVIMWLFQFWPLYLPAGTSILFFYSGLFLAEQKYSLFLLDRFGKRVSGIYLIFLLLDVMTKHHPLNPVLHRLGIIMGMVGALYWTRFLIGWNPARKWCLKLAGSSFFVFAVHEPLLTAIRKLSYQNLQPDNSLVILFLYFVIPMIVILMAYLAYIAMQKKCPKLLGLLTGHR